jgi:cyclopropane fatty-acyl-phospholipid synthase-like methyltransferase
MSKPERKSTKYRETRETAASRLKIELPRASKYSRRWVLSNSLGENVLYNAESLCKALGIRRGMKVLDLGCGTAISSIFIAKEFKCNVWAVDKNVPVHENYARIKAARADRCVVPVQTDAWTLPFPKSFFDIIIAVDSYMYYGEDQKFLPYVIQFLKPGGLIGVLDACFTREITPESRPPGFLRSTWRTIWRRLHSIRWWRRFWEQTGLVRIVRVEMLGNSDELIRQYAEDRMNSPTEGEVARTLRRDKRHFIKLFRMIGQKKNV